MFKFLQNLCKCDPYPHIAYRKMRQEARNNYSVYSNTTETTVSEFYQQIKTSLRVLNKDGTRYYECLLPDGEVGVIPESDLIIGEVV